MPAPPIPTRPEYMPPGLASMAVPLADLHDDPQNARRHGDRNLAVVQASLLEFGWRGVVVAHRDTKQILAGHARVEAARRLGWKTAPVLFVDDERARALAFAVADNRSAELAEWDWQNLSNILEELATSGLDEVLGFDGDDLDALLHPPVEPPAEPRGEIYTKTVKAPIYRPTSPEPPALALLADRTKVLELTAAIDAAALPDELADFLRAAAQRHVAFNYAQIAEYYAHAPADVQRLMEASALVIIDFNAAIEGGFVQLSADLAAAYRQAEDEDG